MKLLTATEFSLQLIGSHLSDDMPKSTVFIDGKHTGTILDGAILEAAIRWNSNYLVFVTDAILHEDTLRIYLLSATLELCDAARLGGMYTTGAFSLLELQEPDTVRFLFFGDTEWRLQLLEKAEWRLPWISDPPGVWRKPGWRRRFKVYGHPKPSDTHFN